MSLLGVAAMRSTVKFKHTVDSCQTACIQHINSLAVNSVDVSLYTDVCTDE